MTDLEPFEDPDHEGNSARWRTGRRCLMPGCREPAGTWWSKLWCHRHNVERMRRIDAAFNNEIAFKRGE